MEVVDNVKFKKIFIFVMMKIYFWFNDKYSNVARWYKNCSSKTQQWLENSFNTLRLYVSECSEVIFLVPMEWNKFGFY